MMKIMLQLILWSILCFMLGIFSYRLYQSRLIRLLPDQSPLRIQVYFGEFFTKNDNSLEGPFGDYEDIRVIVAIENKGQDPVHFESWSVRSLNAQGYLRQLFSFPQNFVQTLKPGERMNFEISDLDFLTKGQLYTIILRDIYGREWQVSGDEMEKLRKDLFWQKLV